MITAEHESARPPHGEGFGDAVTFSFGDAGPALYGLARIGLAAQDGVLSALVLLFSGREVAAASVEGGIERSDAGWEAIEAGPVRAEVLEPLAKWALRFDGDGAALRLTFSAHTAPLASGEGVAAVSGLAGYEQLCRVEGDLRVDGQHRSLECLGQRGHVWGPSAWDRIELARSVGAWLDGPRALIAESVRPVEATDHDAEVLSAFICEPDDGDVGGITEVAEPRLSTTYDGEGRQLRAGLELWVSDSEQELPRRASGTVACGTSLELGRLRLDCAFMNWSMEGHSGVGRYDIVRRA